MFICFDIRPDEYGWTVFDRLTGEPALLDGFAATGLPLEDAEEIMDLLNTLSVLKGSASGTRQ